MNREYGGFDSRHLSRKMEFLWFGHAGPPVVMFPTSMGRYYQCEDFGLVGSLVSKVDRGELQLACVDSVDEESWYNRHVPHEVRVHRHEQYDAYLRDEFVPFVLTKSGDSQITTFGASFGGYHAANFGARYPNLVRKIVAFSGVFDIHRFLDGFWNDACYFHCPTAYMANADDPWIKRYSSISWVIATGENDTLIGENRYFTGLLSGKGIPHYFEVWPGFGHDWPWWNQHAGRFLA